MPSNLSFVQKAYLVLVNERGELPKNTLTPEVGFIGAAIATLMDAGVLALSKDGFFVTRGELPEECAHLSEMFEFVQAKSPAIKQFAQRFNSVVSGKAAGKLVEAVGASLAEEGLAHEVKKAFLGRRRFAPNPEAQEAAVKGMRAVALDQTDTSAQAQALAIVLDRAELLERFFSKKEARAIMDRNDEVIAAREVPPAVIQMVQYIKFVTYSIKVMPLLANDENKLR